MKYLMILLHDTPVRPKQEKKMKWWRGSGSGGVGGQSASAAQSAQKISTDSEGFAVQRSNPH